ncbi:hypothetical protein Tco_0814053 [Tanacetum coccineum]
MAARNIFFGVSNNVDPTNNAAGLADLLTQIVANLNARRTNDEEGSSNVRYGCSYKTFMASKPKDFYGTQGVVGLLSWFESVELNLSISKYAEGNKVEYTACLLQGRVLNWWNTQEKRVDRYIWSLVPEIRRMVTSSNPITLQAVVGLAFHLTNDVVRSSRASKVIDSGRNRHETSRETELVIIKIKGNENCQRRVRNNRRSLACYECGSFDHLRSVCSRLNRAPNNKNKNNNARNQRAPVRGRLHVIGAEEIRLDPNLMTGKETLIVQGEKLVRDLKIVSAIKMRKYLEKECFVFLAHVVEKDPKVKLIKETPVVRDNLEAFPKDFPGLPPPRQVEF